MSALAPITFELHPHRTLSDSSARLFLASVFTVSFTGAAIAAAYGAWPALVFAALQFAGIRAALRHNMRERDDLHLIIIGEDTVTVQITERGRTTTAHLARHWTRVRLCPSPFALHPARLMVESEGRAYEIGSFLTDEGRRALSRELTLVIGRMGESPQLPLHSAVAQTAATLPPAAPAGRDA
ncbi:MAG: DUF2244 domain-containing protein [Steroidobacteraceae bacterium]|nr:DUF2244 domain-containing protein [Steroidobacteraceae bacterium]